MSETEDEAYVMASWIAAPLGVALAYVSTSLLLLRYPTILHKKKNVNVTVTDIGWIPVSA